MTTAANPTSDAAPEGRRVSRRTVLGATAAGTTLLAAGRGEAVWAAPRSAPTSTMLAMGVLTAGGSSLARSGDGVVAGLRLGLARGGVTVALSRRDVPGGYDGLAAAARDLLAGGAQVLVAGVAEPHAATLATLCRDAGAGLMLANVGAHVVAAPADGEVLAVRNSLQHWQAAFSLGQWSARQLGGSLFQVIAAPDAGYDSVFALRRGFVGGGGTVAGFALTHAGPESPSIAAVARQAIGSGARVIGVSASGRRAVDLVRGLRMAGVRARIVVDPLVLDGPTLAALGGAGVGVHTVTPWVRLDAELTRTARRATGRSRDPFTVLGHDSGVMLADAARRVGGEWARLPQVLGGRRLTGARGLLRIDAARGTVSTPLVVRRVCGSGRAATTRDVVRRDRIGSALPAMAILRSRETGSYVNEYLTT